MIGNRFDPLRRRDSPFTWGRWHILVLVTTALIVFVGIVTITYSKPTASSQALRPVHAITTALPLAAEAFRINTIAMVSASEGWIGGYETGTMHTLPLLHYLHSQWTPILGPAAKGGTITSIAMLSATEGWAVGYDSNDGFILHYTKGHWIRVPIPHVILLSGIAMVSATEGWAVGVGIDSNTNNTIGMILHYTGGHWILMSSPTSTWLRAIAMVSATEGWAVGELDDTDNGSQLGIILHYTYGHWTRALIVTPSPGGDFPLDTITMVSASEGWATGEVQIHNTNLLHYLHGQWIRDPGPASDSLTDVAMVSAKEGWGISALGGIFHYSNGQWTQVDIESSDSTLLTHIVMVSASEGWAVGCGIDCSTGVILHYINGQWHDTLPQIA